jgi:hypothetical protein
MSVFETVVIVISIMNLISLVLTFLMYSQFMSTRVYISQIHSGLASVLGKVISVEHTTVKMAQGFTEMIATIESVLSKLDSSSFKYGNQIFKTKDGKYTGSSVDELLEKIRDAGEESEYFSDTEIDQLRKLFDDGSDDEDDDEEGFNLN